MPQLLPLSRAARLVGVSRGELQSRIRNNELITFEGMIRVSDLLRVFPDTRLQDDSAIERTERIKALASPKTETSTKLPSAKVLASRVTELSKELIESRSESGHYIEILQELDNRLTQINDLGPGELPEKVRELQSWVKDQVGQLPDVPKRKTELLARDTFLRMVEARVKLVPSGHEYYVQGADTLLEAGLRAGYALKYGCTQGSCSKCKARIVSGEVLRVRDHEYQLTQTEHNLGYILMCSYTAVTDLVIEADEARSSDDIPQHEIQAQLRRLERPVESTVILYLKTVSVNSLRFLAGQMVRLTLPTGESQMLPIASCPCDGSQLEFHVHQSSINEFSTKIIEGGLPKDMIVTLAGPIGDFVLQLDSDRPIIFFAIDEGFAVIKSLIENAISLDLAKNYQLCWITRGEDKYYMPNRCRTWADALDNFKYEHVLLNKPYDANTVRDLLQEKLKNLESIDASDIYMVGSGELLDVLGDLLESYGSRTEFVKRLNIDSLG